MNNNLINLLKDKPVVVPKILFSNFRLLEINDSEMIVIMLLMAYGNKVMYNPEEFSKEINFSKHEIMKIINNLIEKNIISLIIEKSNKKTCEYISLDLLYEKIFNILIDNNSVNDAEDISIFSVFESELGRMLSPMEYEQIKEWITDGNSNELIICALREAVLKGVGNLRYIDSILNDWKKKGYKKKNDIIKEREEYRNKKQKVEVFDTDWLNE